MAKNKFLVEVTFNILHSFDNIKSEYIFRIYNSEYSESEYIILQYFRN